MNTELISVVIPAYNRAWSLPGAVNSVLNQTDGNFEIVLVDDGSQDETPVVIDALLKEDSRIRSFRLPLNGGAQQARNIGIRQAQGQWVAFLDSDDEWLPDRLATTRRKARTSECPIVHGPCLKKERQRNKLSFLPVPRLNGWVYSSLLKGPGPMFQGLLVKKSCLETIGLLDETIVSYQEWDTAIRLARYYPFAYVDAPLFIYNIHPNDSISRSRKRDADGWAQVVHKFELEIQRHCGSQVLAAHFRKIATKYYDAKLYGQASAYFRAAAHRLRYSGRALAFLQARLAQRGLNPRLADLESIVRTATGFALRALPELKGHGVRVTAREGK